MNIIIFYIFYKCVILILLKNRRDTNAMEICTIRVLNLKKSIKNLYLLKIIQIYVLIFFNAYNLHHVWLRAICVNRKDLNHGQDNAICGI